MHKTPSATKKRQSEVPVEDTVKRLVLTGADIVGIGEDAELLVGGKNYNTALISRVAGVRIPQFRAISSRAFHIVLDECRVCGALVRTKVDEAYSRIDWTSEEVTQDHDFLTTFVRTAAADIRAASEADPTLPRIRLRTFINNVVDGFASSQEDIDQLRKRSVMVQAAILSAPLPKEVDDAVRSAYHDICTEAEAADVPVAVRSSAAGEDSRKKAFAGLQDTFLNMVGDEAVSLGYHWDCASAYNLRSMIYRREAILDALTLSESTGDENLSVQAKKEWAIENTSLSVCIMRMINPVVSGTAFSADTATGCRGTERKDLVSIDASYGLGEAVVGGMVTPDKLYVYQKDDGSEVVVRFMGSKTVKIVYDENGGTKQIPVPSRESMLWALTLTQAEQVAKGVRSVSKAYGGMIMDTEFCIDSKGVLWFVQARPETRWNEEFELHPDTIFMRRREVEPKAAASAEILLTGNGASRGAGQGKVRFLRSALELNRVGKGEILAAERTDPDMVPGMRVASAILADVGGDTSHAAITSRELGIAAVIGIQNPMGLQALDGLDVTVDGTRGRVYRGLLPLHHVGGEMNVATLPATKTRVGLVLADVGQALFLSRLRTVPDFEVGLLRAEFMLGNVGVHPAALEAFDNGDIERLAQIKIDELDSRLRKTIREQLDAGLVSLDLRLREHVGNITGYTEELTKLSKKDDLRNPEEIMAVYRRMREVEKLLDDTTERAARYYTVLETSADLAEHVRVIMGHQDELMTLLGDTPEVKARRAAIEKEVSDQVSYAALNPAVQETLRQIAALREDVGARCGLAREIAALRSIPGEIGTLIRARGHKNGREHYVQTLAQGLALFAMAFYGKPIVYRTTDFKTNEYRNLLGGILFEEHEDNPMLGYRGVARDIHDWEIEAFKQARSAYGARNLQLMLPFVRTLEQARSMRSYLDTVHNLRSGEDDLKIILMSELPSNAILARQFIQEFDGFSIGSNDMTQMVLATDRDNTSLSHIYDEEDPAVIWAILVTIFTGQKYNKKVGFCGQGVANSQVLRGLVAISGITAASVVPDTYYQTKQDFAAVEALNIPASGLGKWLGEQHQAKLCALLEKTGHADAAKLVANPVEIQGWYDRELNRLHSELRDSLTGSREAVARKALKTFRATFHKPVIYAAWG
ncbi:MAG: PEP/pyruvate-binding domain-containing protein, partial [Bilophila sp.]